MADLDLLEGGAITDPWLPPEEDAAPLDYPWETVEPGWYEVPMDEYLSWPILSASLALLLTHHHDRTPAYLRWAMTREREESEGAGSAPALLGSLTHTVVLEPDKLESEYVIEPEPDPAIYTKADGTESSNPRATGAWRDMIAQLRATGKTVVTAEQYEAAKEMRDKLYAHPRARQLMDAEGPVEATLVGRDPTTGLLLKIRPDKLIPGVGYHVNVKTTDNAGREAFMRSCYNFGYYVGLAFYERVLRGAGWDHRRAVFLALETAGAKQVATWEADAGMIGAGHEVLDKALPYIAECVERDHWPTHPTNIEPITLPHWAWRRVDDYLAIDPNWIGESNA